MHSFQRFQHEAPAELLFERAQLIIEILTMIPKSIRQKIQSQTKWVHILTPISYEDQFKTKLIGRNYWKQEFLIRTVM